MSRPYKIPSIFLGNHLLKLSIFLSFRKLNPKTSISEKFWDFANFYFDKALIFYKARKFRFCTTNL